VVWEISSWKGGNKSTSDNNDNTSDAKDVSMQSSSDMKPDSDVAMEDNPAPRPESMALSTPAASSPAPPMPASIAV